MGHEDRAQRPALGRLVDEVDGRDEDRALEAQREEHGGRL